MSKILDEVMAANAAYAKDFGNKGGLAMPPARRFAILTCMDARLDPAKFAGLAEGDAHVIRNAGGRASDDAVRSLVISYKLLGTREWFVIHHTNCGMETFNDSIMRSLRNHPLVPGDIPIYGYIYDVKSGRLIEVPEATEAGRTR
jgi:carbonic anhydrase